MGKEDGLDCTNVVLLQLAGGDPDLIHVVPMRKEGAACHFLCLSREWSGVEGTPLCHDT
jgi:hypothetical protein